MALRRFVLMAVSVCGLAAAAVNPALPEVKRIYLLPMSNGLDQYLANRLTKLGRFEVVTNPDQADAVFTDRIGIAFEERWKELYPPPPPPPKPVETEAAKDKDKDKDKSKKDKAPESLEATVAPLVRISSFTRGKGNVFLVSRKTGVVIWSHYAVPKNIRTKSLDNTADKIVDRLHDDLKQKK
jgi:hypothetical protein